MTDNRIYSTVTLDYKLLHKYCMFFITTANDIIESSTSRDLGAVHMINNYETMQSRYESMKIEHARFLDLLRESPHINPDLKEKILSLRLNSRGNTRIRFVDRFLLVLSFYSRNWFARADYTSVKSDIRSNVLKEFRDRMSEITVEIQMNYL